jgi:hypothetical protein
MDNFLRRYTEIPFIIDYLYTQQLALLDPSTWDDRNDSFYIEEYAKQSGYESVYALCLADGAETYHHWKVFSQGSGGACIQFDRDLLIDAVKECTDLRAEKVNYKTINQLRKNKPELNELPFLKRYAFIHEDEFRLFYASKVAGPPIHRIAVPLSCINRIILSPWLPQTVADRVKDHIKLIPGCSTIKIYRSTLVENEDWKRFANGST